jgi:hypothetical protein
LGVATVWNIPDVLPTQPAKARGLEQSGRILGLAVGPCAPAAGPAPSVNYFDLVLRLRDSIAVDASEIVDMSDYSDILLPVAPPSYLAQEKIWLP